MAGISRLRAEAASAGYELQRATENTLASAAQSVRRAERIAKNYAQHWTKAGGSSAPAAAAAATKSHLEQIAATESSEAFSGARARYLREQPQLGLLRVWDATLDKHTCPICNGADGTIVGAREPFPAGEPGSVHPWCRCSWQLLTPTEAHGITTYEPRAQLILIPSQAR